MVREDFVGKIILWFFVSVLIGFILASYRYPFFIEEDKGNWKLSNPTTVEANLLVIASLLIGVAVVQGQNLNRFLDMRYQMRKNQKQPTTNASQVYDYLRIGFWLLSVDILVVVLLLALAIIFGTNLSQGQAFILATAWWSTIVLIIAGWICLAIVGGRSYKD